MNLYISWGFWFDFSLFLDFDFDFLKIVKSKMVGQMTSYDVITNKNGIALVEKAQGYLISVNLFTLP